MTYTQCWSILQKNELFANICVSTNIKKIMCQQIKNICVSTKSLYLLSTNNAKTVHNKYAHSVAQYKWELCRRTYYSSLDSYPK